MTDQNKQNKQVKLTLDKTSIMQFSAEKMTEEELQQVEGGLVALVETHAGDSVCDCNRPV